MDDKRKYLGSQGDSDEDNASMLLPGFFGMEDHVERSDLPPDPGYTGRPNEALANTHSKGHLAVADMDADNGGGDITEGVSYRTRMAGQAPETFYEEDKHG